ncbi:hypothetical protein AB0L63_27165 [Nocardia sp. NPDC051990]
MPENSSTVAGTCPFTAPREGDRMVRAITTATGDRAMTPTISEGI